MFTTAQVRETPPGALTLAEVAGRFHLHPQTLRRWVAAGRLPALRTSTGRGGRLRFRLCDVEALEAEMLAAANPEARA